MEYKCFKCAKVIDQKYIQKRVQCPFCGSKIIIKQRTRISRFKAE
jgi:DNA-directed RNA polymerase subunit RPC12/RpoP